MLPAYHVSRKKAPRHSGRCQKAEGQQTGYGWALVGTATPCCIHLVLSLVPHAELHPHQEH